MKRLTDNEVDYNLTTLKGWSLNDNRIVKDFSFKDFTAAFNVMCITQIGTIRTIN